MHVDFILIGGDLQLLDSAASLLSFSLEAAFHDADRAMILLCQSA
jgi:hypothetical protein